MRIFLCSCVADKTNSCACGVKLIMFLKEYVPRNCILLCSFSSQTLCHVIDCTSKSLLSLLPPSQLEMLKQPGMIIAVVLGNILKLVLTRDIGLLVPI